MTIVSELPNSTNFVRSLAGIRRAEVGQRSVESPGFRESPAARATAPQMPMLSRWVGRGTGDDGLSETWQEK